MLKYPDQSVRVLVQGLARIELRQFAQRDPYFVAKVARLEEIFTPEALKCAKDVARTRHEDQTRNCVEGVGFRGAEL